MTNEIRFSEEQISSLNTLVAFLSRRDINDLTPLELDKYYGTKKADLLILLGNSIPYTSESAANAFKNNIAKEFMIVGGIGHSTDLLRKNVRMHKAYGNIEVDGRSEAEIFKDIIVENWGIDEKNIILENKSTNCGANAREALKIIKEHGMMPKTVILIQDPTMQLRTWASFQKEWEDEKNMVFINYSPFIPYIEASEEAFSYKLDSNMIYGLWDSERFLSLVMGEIPRLRDDKNGYGPKGKGFINHVDIPQKVIDAYEYLLPFFDGYMKMRKV